MSFSLFRTLFRARCDAMASIPGPEPSLPLGTAADFFRGQPWETCSRYAKEYGGLTRIWLGPSPALVLNDPKLMGEVLDGSWHDFHKEAPCRALAPVITSGSLFISNQPEWKSLREQHPLQQVNSATWQPQLIEPLRRVFTRRLNQWCEQPASKPLDLYWEMQRLSFDVFSQAFWGETFSPERFRWFQTMARTGSRRMMLPAALTSLPPLSPWFHSQRKAWYASYEALVSQTRRSPSPDRTDLLAVTLRNGTQLSDAALTEALATNYFGGVFSCSSAINTALYHLAKFPTERTKLQQSLNETFPAGKAWDYGTLMNCRPLDFVLREALRYFPPVPLYFRVSPRDRTVKLGNHDIPPGTLLFINQWFPHRGSEHWGDPENFRPARWDGGVAEDHPVGSDYFFPFGRGPRMCVGAEFAMFYMKLALATIMLETEPTLDPKQPYKQSFFFGVMMPKGLRGSFRKK